MSVAYETEMKAWVDEWEPIERALRERCVYRGTIDRADRYFRSADPLLAPPAGPTFRIRTEGDKHTVTFKEKSREDGVEFNLEREFDVSDPDAFVHLVHALGYVDDISKTKSGFQFKLDDLTVELVHLGGLGDFLEVEFVNTTSDRSVRDAAAARIRAFLTSLAGGTLRIEEKPYNQLLRETRPDVRKSSALRRIGT